MVIPSGKTCNVDVSAFADTIVVESEATLNILSGSTLTLDNDNDHVTASDPDHSIVDGAVLLRYEPNPAVLKVVETIHGFKGDGRIEGYDATARVEIDANVTLINGLSSSSGGFVLAMTIQGLTGSGQTNGTFRNEGVVSADGEVVMHADTIIEDVEDAVWTVERCPSRLRFDRETLTLDGDFIITVSGGAFVFNADITTCGELIYNSPGLLFTNGAVFEYATFSGSQANPGTIMKWPPDCSNPWAASSNDSPCAK